MLKIGEDIFIPLYITRVDICTRREKIKQNQKVNEKSVLYHSDYHILFLDLESSQLGCDNEL